MELSSQQVRKLCIAGTVSFPAPFPSVGSLTFLPFTLGVPSHDLSDEATNGVDEKSSESDSKTGTYVVIEESSKNDSTMVRSIALSDVKAIFFPGVLDDCGDASEFEFALPSEPVDFDKGKWILIDGKTDVRRIESQLHVNPGRLGDRCRPARGIVFVSEGAPVLSTFETYLPAGEASQWMPYSLFCCTGG